MKEQKFKIVVGILALLFGISLIIFSAISGDEYKEYMKNIEEKVTVGNCYDTLGNKMLNQTCEIKEYQYLRGLDDLDSVYFLIMIIGITFTISGFCMLFNSAKVRRDKQWYTNQKTQ